MNKAFENSSALSSNGRVQTFVLCLLVAGSSVASVSAQSNNDAPPLVIYATREPTDPSKLGSSVTVITAADIEKAQAATVIDALQSVPGISISQTGGMGASSEIYIRGAETRHTKIIVDGIDMGDPSTTARTYNLSDFLTSDIERIEIIRGAQSGLYGSDAIGGVIAITTKKGTGTAKATIKLEAGSFGTFNKSASLSGSDGLTSYSLNISDFLTAHQMVTPKELAAPYNRQRNSDFYNNRTASFRLGHRLSENVELNWVGRGTLAGFKYSGDNYVRAYGIYLPNETRSSQETRQLFTRGEAIVSSFDGKWKNYFGYGYANQNRNFYSPNYDPERYTGQTNKFDWRSVGKINSWQTLVIGAERSAEQLESNTSSAKNGNTAAFFELQSVFTKNFYVSINGRNEWNDTFGRYATYRLAPTYFFDATGTRLKYSIGSGFKAPTLDQLFVDYPDWGYYSNRNLKPETSKGWDVGVEQSFLADKAKAGITFFDNDIRNLISTSQDGCLYYNVSDPTVCDFYRYINANVARSTSKGAETFLQYKFSNNVKLGANYTYTDARNAETHQLLVRRPKNRASVTTSWEPTYNSMLSASVVHVGEMIDYDRPTFTKVIAPSYTVFNIAANYKPTKDVTLFGRVDNLFNKRYQSALGFQKAGIGVFGGISISN